MTYSDTRESLRGYNWSIERGLVGPDIAEAAAREILDAIALGDEMISFDHEQPKNRYRGYLINGLDQLTDEQMAAPTFGFTALMLVRDALRPFKDPKLLVDNDAEHYDQAFVNVMAPRGKIPWHRDNEPWSLAFVNLDGDVRVGLQDLKLGGRTEEVLRSGDGLNIINSTKRKSRPRHKLVNLSKSSRISYGEYTRPASRVDGSYEIV